MSTSAWEGSSTPRPGQLYSGQRVDLQGVRGVGVLCVVLGHLFLWPHGVFAALDLFFVLSGYLITSILLVQLPRHGARFFAVFYLARARRLMPMALLVLAVTTLATYAVFSTSRGNDVAVDALWAAIFGANWHFAAEGTDYFSQQAASPLLHYWSLSVEEQFYLAWPLLVLVAAVVARKRGARPETLAYLVLGLVTVLSFGYSLWHSASQPTVAYFSTFDRAWEFGAGGLLAVAAPRLVRIPLLYRQISTWVFLVVFVVTIFTLEPSMPFPAPWGLVPVAITSAAVISGLDGDTAWSWVLHNPVMVWFGDRSYSLYLWHLPVQVLLVPFFATDSPAYYVAALSTSVLLTVVGYELVERPMRRAPWLMLRTERARRAAAAPSVPVKKPTAKRAPRGRRRPTSRRPGRRPVGGLAWRPSPRWGWAGVAGVVALGAIVVGQMQGPGTPVAATDLVQGTGQPAALRAALDRTAFPTFDPSLESIADTTWEEQQAKYGCGETDPGNLSSCRFGKPTARRTVAVFGDSVAGSWMPTVRKAFVPAGWAVQQLTLPQCSPWVLSSYIEEDGSAYPACAAFHQVVESYLRRMPPDLLIVADASQQSLNSQRSEIGGTQESVARDALGRFLAQVPDGIEVMVLGAPPPIADLRECVSRVGGPLQCARSPDQLYEDHKNGELAAAQAAGVTYLDTLAWFCVDDSCPGFVGDTPVTYDGTHLTVQFGQQLAPLLSEAVDQATDGRWPGRASAGG
ncbi:acyltransferase family protein [Nocardioides acrostichi]|uniref:Acyltransferase n=1 Tax=Nocardioides acrostichi TaxID=2784339 RepID=A0A930V2F6_9ACTN|nr:acyltransferase family protein [Nocardioides acrostichi]MBF4162557.1 acyltransferase [Nocardioides acrostichi]